MLASQWPVWYTICGFHIVSVETFVILILAIKYRIMNTGGVLLKIFNYFIENTIFLKENTRDMYWEAKVLTEVLEDVPKTIAAFL